MTELSECNYRVKFKGVLNEEAEQALDAAGLIYRAGHGAGVAAEGGPLPEATAHSIYLRADSEDEAVQRVRSAVERHGTLVAFEVEPFMTDQSE